MITDILEPETDEEEALSKRRASEQPGSPYDQFPLIDETATPASNETTEAYDQFPSTETDVKTASPYDQFPLIEEEQPARSVQEVQTAAAPAPVAQPDTIWGDTKLFAKVVTTGLYSAVADVLPKTLAEVWLNGDLSINDAKSAVAQYRNKQIEDLKRYDLTPQEAENKLFGIIKAKHVLAGLQNLGYSGASAIGGMAVGAAAATAISPGTPILSQVVGGALGAGLATAPIAYRASKTQFVSDMRDKLLANKPRMTEAEWQRHKTLFEKDAQLYALWEAAPEVVGNMLTAGILKTPAGKLIGQIPLIKNQIARVLAQAGVKVALDMPVEVGTEVVTGMGQGTIEYKQGLRKDAPTWAGTAQDVTPQTIVTTLATLGLGSVSNIKGIERQTPKAKAAALEETRSSIRAQLVKIGIPEDTVDKSGIVDRLMAAKNDAERNKVLERFALEATAVPPVAFQEQPVEQATRPQGQPIVGEPIPQPLSTVLNAPEPSEPVVMPEGTPATGKGVEPFTFDDENKTVDKYGRRVDGKLNLIAEPVAAVAPVPEVEKPVARRMTIEEQDATVNFAKSLIRVEHEGSENLSYLDDAVSDVINASTPDKLTRAIRELRELFPNSPLQALGPLHDIAVQRMKAVDSTAQPPPPGDTSQSLPGITPDNQAGAGGRVDVTAPVQPQAQPATPVEPAIPAPAAAPPAPAPAVTAQPPAAQPEAAAEAKPAPPAPAKPVAVSEETPDIKQVGNDTVIRGTRDEEFQGKYVIVPRKTLIASHDPASLFAKNSEYPLENTRDYSAQSAEAQSERGKVLKIAQTFRPNEHVSLAGSASEGPVIAAHITDENGTRRLVVLGGNGRQMAIQSMSPAKRQALFEQTNKQAEQFGVQALPDAEHQLIRYIGEYDMRKAGVRAQVQAIVDSLNPSPGQVQSLSAMAKDDAQINIKMEDLSDISIEITEQEAQNKMNDLLASNKIDANTRKAIASDPAQAQEYMRRLLVHAAFRSQTLANFAQKTAREKLPGRVLIETATKSMIELRRKGESGIPDAVGRTFAEVIDYIQNGDTLPVALKKAAQQQQMDPTYGIVLDIATAMYDRVSLNKKGKINTDATIDAFIDFWERVSLFVKAWEKHPNLLFGEPMSIEAAFNTFLTNLHKEQAAYNGEISTAPKDKRESRKKVDIFSKPAPELPGTEVPFNLFGDVISPETRAAEEAKRVKRAEAEAQRELDARAQELGFMPEVRANSAQAKVDQLTANWKNKPKGGIVVVQTVEDADEFKLSSDSMSIIREGKTEGFYHIPSDTVVIIADNLNQTEDVIRVALHETTIHSGLRGLLGKEFDAELANIGKEIPASDLTDIALRYGLDLSKRADRLVAYEEYLAMYAETRTPKLYDRFIMAIKRALRAMGISDSVINWLDTRGAIDQIVDAGREYVERGRRGAPLIAGEGIRMSKALPPPAQGARVPAGTPAKEMGVSQFLTRTLEGRTPLGATLTLDEVMWLTDYLPYVIQHNPDTLDKTAAFIKENGPALAEEKFFRGDASILAAVRVPLGRALIKLHGEAAKKTTNQQEIAGHRAAGFDLWLKVTELGREAGQMVQSFAIDAAEMLEMPGGAEFLLNKRVEDVVRAEINNLPVKMTDVVQAAKESDIKVVDDALVDKLVQERLGTILERLGTKVRNGMIARLQNAENRKKLDAALESVEYKADIPADLRFARTIEDKIAHAVTIGARLIHDAKTLNYGDWSAKMTAKYGEGIAPHLRRIWNESCIYIDTIISAKASRATASTPGRAKAHRKAPAAARIAQPQMPVTIEAEANRIVRAWLSEDESIAAPGEIIKQNLAGVVQQLPGAREVPLQKQKTIIESLQELGFTPAEGVMFASEVQRAAFQRAKAEKAKRLQQLLRGKPVSKINQAAIERIMEISNLQRLDEAAIIDAFAAKIGLPKLTPELSAKLQAMAEQIRTAPEGSDKVEATRRLMGFIEDQMPLVKSNIFWAMWYANMLSGYQTAERNVLSTFNNVTADLVTSMLIDPKNAGFALSGFITGIRKGWREAKNIVKTGEFPAHMVAQGKIEAPTVLERNVFKGWARVFNNWKYVLRSMIAEDALFFLPAQESRARMIAADVARAEGKSGKELWTRVAEIMGESQEQLAAFETQARAEGKTGERLQRRIDELAERQRPADIRAQSIEYAKRGTFNYQPEGVAGILAQKIREASKRVPLLRVIVPFTNIVANVTNTSLDYSPWGAVRVLTGRLQVGGGRRNIVGHERAQLLAKSFIGTTAMVAAYALDRLQGGDDDDDQGWFAIYGSGAGSSAKNNQMRERGWRPWSIRIGRAYYDYRLTPIAIPFGIIGSIRDAERWRKMDEQSIQLRTAFATLRALSVINDMSFMAGLTEFVEMMNVDSAEQANKMARSFFARQTIGAITPNLFKQLDRTFDPLVRDNATIMDALLREIPIVSRLGSPKLNVLGEPIKQTTGPLSLVIAHGKDDPVWNLIVANEAWISVPSKTQHIGKRLMTETEYYSFIKYRGEILREKIERNLSRFEGRDKEWVNKRIDDYTRDAAESAKRRVKRESR